eukprot:6616786-Alexandrium_andersonii.AAC.1
MRAAGSAAHAQPTADSTRSRSEPGQAAHKGAAGNTQSRSSRREANAEALRTSDGRACRQPRQPSASQQAPTQR